MLRTSSRLKLLTLSLIFPAGLTLAQQQMPAQPGQQPGQQQNQRTTPQAQPSTPQTPAQQRAGQQPPQTERIEPGSDVPATTIPRKEGTRITEKRDNRGQVTEVEVESGPSRYTLRPNSQVGTAQPGDALSSQRGPTWMVREFDFGNPKKQGATEEAVAPAPARATSTPGASGATIAPVRADAPPPPPMEPVQNK